METKTYRQFRQSLDNGANVVPLVRELPADLLTAVSAFLRLKSEDESAFLLESVEGGDIAARYTFLGVKPFQTLAVCNGQAFGRRADGEVFALDGNPFAALGDYMDRFRALEEPGLPRFCGGAVGYLGYEMVRYVEPSVRFRDSGDDEARLLLFRDAVAFDRVRHRLLLVANAIVEGPAGSRRAYDAACDALDQMEARLNAPGGELPALGPRRTRPAKTFTPPLPDGTTFMANVRALKRHIRAGDIFQGVPSAPTQATLHAKPFDVYRALRTVNPSPYMFYIDMGDQTVLGASPEMLVRVEGRRVQTRPIAGTRPRGENEAEDRRNEQSLLRSVKENAEHLMLVDLSRNDVGRVAKAGTVRVASFSQVERYSHVMHLVSSVEGRLERGRSAWDALMACFPAGTVTGAPKIRAMQLIAELEKSPRGLYAGAVVYHDFRGNLDSAIAIRCMVVRGRGRRATARSQAGAGIVFDSRPEQELLEIQNKARAVWEAVRIAEKQT